MNLNFNEILEWFLNIGWVELLFGMVLSFALAFFFGEKINEFLIKRFGEKVYYYEMNFSLHVEYENEIRLDGYILTISQKLLDHYNADPSYPSDELHHALNNALHLQYGISYRKRYERVQLLLNDYTPKPKYKWQWRTQEYYYD